MKKHAIAASLLMTLLVSLAAAASQAVAPVYGGVPPVPIQDLKCYRSAEPPTINPGPVILTDQFGTETVTVRQNFPFSILCTSALKDATGTPQELHWKVYFIPDGKIKPGVVTATDQFGTRDLDLGTAIFLLVPALKILPGTTEPDGIDTTELDGIVSNVHWKCYGVVGEFPLIDPPIVTLEDQFITEKVDPSTAEDFCTPVIKKVPGKEPVGTLDAPHLICYAISGDFAPGLVGVIDQFGSEKVNLSFADLMYTLAVKGAIVGGEIVPIGSTALLVAGAFTNAYWILPILGGIAGAVIAFTRAKRGKTNQ